MGRIFVIGDIHGAYKALIQCLERSGFDKEKDTLISLGDIADGYSQVPECVEELLTIPNLIPIGGNHDEWASDWLEHGNAPRIWTGQGGQSTKDAYDKKPELKEKHFKEFFKKQLPYYIDDKNRAFVHAGWTRDKGLGHESMQSTYWWTRDLWQIAYGARKGVENGSNKLPVICRAHEEIFIGHTHTLTCNSDEPINACNVWNVDTGAAYGRLGGKLTIMDIDTKEFFQSDNTKDLYPDENGR